MKKKSNNRKVYNIKNKKKKNMFMWKKLMKAIRIMRNTKNIIIMKKSKKNKSLEVEIK
jgi:hypothetical protein